MARTSANASIGQRIDVGIRLDVSRIAAGALAGATRGPEGADLLQEDRAGIPRPRHRPNSRGDIPAFTLLPKARHDAEPHQAARPHPIASPRLDVEKKTRLLPFCPARARRRCIHRSPTDGEAADATCASASWKTSRRQALLVAALAVNAEVLEPLADALRMPAIAVAADQQLVPQAASGIALHLRPQSLGARANRLAVLLGRRRVAQRLVREIARRRPPDGRGGSALRRATLAASGAGTCVPAPVAHPAAARRPRSNPWGRTADARPSRGWSARSRGSP